MADVSLKVKTYSQEGDMGNEYRPLRNLINDNGYIEDFDTDEISVNLNNPVNLECQPSYDGTVNLIINDDNNPPRIVNTRFSKLEDNRYKIINRNQLEQTNLYKIGLIDQTTRLFRNTRKFPKIDLMNVYSMGKMKGGNYTFYIKFADCDYNKTDFVCESSQVAIFKGHPDKLNSISGTLMEEVTDKAATLRISNIDESFSYIYLYYSRSYCDLNGITLTEYGVFKNPYEIKGKYLEITITGFEETTPVTEETLNINYNIVSAVKTQAQVQNMLFFGNVQSDEVKIKELQNIAYFIKVSLKQGNSIGWVEPGTYTVKEGMEMGQSEYYNPINIYYKLGYWPDEIYRLGVVFIMKDDSLTPAFNLRGCEFSGSIENWTNGVVEDDILIDDYGNLISSVPRNEFISGSNYLDNTYGVFKTPITSVIDYDNKDVKPLYFSMEIGDKCKKALENLGVKGFFYVRQKRIETTLCQGYSVGVDDTSYVPMIYDDTINRYISESFLGPSNILTNSFLSRRVYTKEKQCSALLSVDTNCVQSLQARFDGSEFVLNPDSKCKVNLDGRHYYINGESEYINSGEQVKVSSVFVKGGIPMLTSNSRSFSTKCGTAEDVSNFSFFATRETDDQYASILRGIYCPIIGTNSSLEDGTVYNVKIPNFSNSMMKNYFMVRANDESEFFAVSNRYGLDESLTTNVYRGDCFSNTVSIRIIRNFTDPELPIQSEIVDPKTWADNYKGYSNMLTTEPDDEEKDDEHGYYLDINRGDVNAVEIGHWITYKCLSNYNLSLRSENSLHAEEVAVMGNVRSFYPLSGASVSPSNKIEESWLLNQGYNSTVGKRRNFVAPNVPYIKDIFDNRVMFSNVQMSDSFENGYRVFQELSWQDIDRQYGAIVKLVPWGSNLISVFEHGVGILPVNEKALIQTTTQQSIHMYGAGVLQQQITVATPDYGSIWPESIIKTPLGIYGVDTYAKKIWRFSDKGFETISDMKVQRFLNDHIKLSESDKYPVIGLRNVKAHYNNYKGDLLFTFYNERENETWNLCFNERLNKWITRYSWTPLYSENIDNIFYSMDQKRAKLLGCIYNNKNCTFGINTDNQVWDTSDEDFQINLTLNGYSLASTITPKITKVRTSYINGEEIDIIITDPEKIAQLFTFDGMAIKVANYSAFKSYFGSIEIVPVYFILEVELNLTIGRDDPEHGYVESYATTLTEDIGLILENTVLKEEDLTAYTKQKNDFLRNGFYIHGRAGIFNGINYENENMTDQILPTKWYGKQEKFEFEFVVNGEVGLHKIFDNLVIISNNVQPNTIEFEISGDVYEFNKAGIFRAKKFNKDSYIWDTKYNSGKIAIGSDGLSHRYQSTQIFSSDCTIKWDTVLNSYTLLKNQKCKDIKVFGRRFGNIHYKEDAWYLNIEPITYTEKYKVDNEESEMSNQKSVRVRDKFAKVRVSYTGEDLVIITMLVTLLTQSYA